MSVFLYLAVFGLSLWLAPQAVEAATIRFNPSPVEVGLSETADVQIVVSSTISVNSVEVEVSYPTDVVLAVEATAKGTVFPVTVFPPTRDNNTGRAKFTVAVTPPGYTGNSGVVGTISLKGQKLGVGKLRVVAAKVIANDGTGNNVYTGASDGDIVVNAVRKPQFIDSGDVGPVPVVTSTSHPDPSKWYKERNVAFAWEGGEEYSWVFDQNPDTIPPMSSMGSATTTVRSGVGDGVWYMHVRAVKGNTWGATTTVKVQVDGSPPPGFELKFDPTNNGSSSALPLISFETDGAQAGIDRYELSLDGGDFVVVRSPYQMPQVKPGKHTVEVKAIDKAGNETMARADLDVVPLGPKPTLSSPSSGTTLAIGEDNEFKGKAPAGSTVQLFANGQFVVSATANDKGEFTIKLNSQIVPGEYEFKVRAVKTGHLYSEFSDSIKAKVAPGGSGGLAIGGFVVPLWITMILYVVIILALIGGLIYLFIRWRKARRDQKLALQKLELMTEADPNSEVQSDAAPIDTGVGQEKA
jgi:hypothetical protein